MGVGRRMKKQGPPEPLSEAHFEKLKRKDGLSTNSTTEDNEAPSKKRKTVAGTAVPAKKDKNHKNHRSNVAPSKSRAGKRQPDGKSTRDKLTPNSKQMGNGTAKSTRPWNIKNPGKMQLDEPESDEMKSANEFSDSDLDEEKLDKLGDDFLSQDSEDSEDGSGDDSVYDSDADVRKEEFIFSDDEDISDREEKLTAANMESLSKKLDQQLADDTVAYQTELRDSALQTNIDGDKLHVLGDGDEDDVLAAKSKTLLSPDLQMLRTRITDNIRVLDDFAKLAEEGRSRAEYTAQLLKDICAYYGYSEFLAEKLFNLFPPREAFAFFEANESPRPVVIRTNTLRTYRRDLARALINRGVTLEPVGKWSKVGLQIFESNVPLGATPEYLAGHYILQAASSFLPVIALCPQENERCLDMAAAPGGKTTHMAALMKNTGVIFANDPSKQRAKGLIGNIHRLGVRNTIVCNHDAREFPRVMGGFDRVLLDAPCSGTGVIAKDPSIKTNRDASDFLRLPHMQKQLLLAAIDSVNHASKTGGYIVYSTCSVAVEENEQVVNYSLTRRPNVRLVEAGLPFGKEGFVKYMGKQFHPSLRLTRRYYPHTYNVDGFFVAKFKKIGPTPPNAVSADKRELNAISSSASRDAVDADTTPISAGETVDDDGEESETTEIPATNGDAAIHQTYKKSKKTNGTAADDFGPFDDSEDNEYIERARRNAMRRRGLDPHALDYKKARLSGPPKRDGDEQPSDRKVPDTSLKAKTEPEPRKDAKSKGKEEIQTKKNNNKQMKRTDSAKKTRPNGKGKGRG